MKKQGEFWYPDSEERLHRGHSSVHTIDEILPYCHSRNVCVQAGGAAGVWPITFSEHFDEVLTFEPNVMLYECMLKNIAERDIENITSFNHGLWGELGSASLKNIQDDNMGAWHLDMDGDAFTVLALDSIDFDGVSVDLIQLDIEGAEMEVLDGARNTIKEHRPVIVLETKPACLRVFGHTVQDIRNRMCLMGYEQKWRKNRDELWIPLSR